MIIYRVISYTEGFRWYHCSTKAEAIALRRQLLEKSREEWRSVSVEIEEVEVKPTRAGIAKALDDKAPLVNRGCRSPSHRCGKHRSKGRMKPRFNAQH